MTSPNDTNWSHPLITSFQPRQFNRRRLVLMTGAGLAAATSVVPLHLVTAQESSPVAETAISGDDDARPLLERAVRAMAELDTFGFEIETIAGETSIMPGINLGLVEGAVRRPNDFIASVEVSTPVGSLDLLAVGIGDQAWIQDPLSDGEWISLEGIGDISAILNPDTLVLTSISVIQGARLDGEEKVDGFETIRIAGTINLAETAAMVDEAADQISSEPLDVLVWVNAEDQIVEIEISGAILASEDDSVIRSIRFFDFNKPVDIEQPPI
ncbi:MAG TPA: LppX_LprAFG lipoprotein [Thermomicrobiales bacterium]|nr:LppX_LprAFG lipoprotein [Thermomicrobiales bacterium]